MLGVHSHSSAPRLRLRGTAPLEAPGPHTWRDYVGPCAAPALVLGLVAWLSVLLWLGFVAGHAALVLLLDLATRH